ncbi:transcriptional regulator [Clostridium sp. SY8519]|uniref:LysR family transcriptional regulator n=1 Tax=Clostridium sp. (strain SY8519) TaxID=1042156 RepID=UPI00021721DA|nr:LysR family transcriptional regulator [Clostridium sp. SY8519]BAK46870.1 transcriptional regulator [Clostridium sp. SY8519]
MHNVDVRNVSLGQIMYFVKVAESLSVSAAAEYFNLTQPTLSKKIASLEAQLDLQLFIRTNRIVALTPAGQYLYEQWRYEVSRLEEDIQFAHVLQTGKSKSVVIGIMDSFDPEQVILPLLADFSRKYPDIHLRVESDAAQDVRNMLMRGEADLVFSILYDYQDRELSQIEYRELGAATHCACMRKSNPLSGAESLSVADLREAEFVCISPRQLPEYVRMLQRLCEPYGFAPNITNYVSSANSLTLNINSDNEVFICDRYYLDVNAEKHVKVPLRDTHSSIVLAWRKENEKTYLKDVVEEALHFFG